MMIAPRFPSLFGVFRMSCFSKFKGGPKKPPVFLNLCKIVDEQIGY